MCNRLCEVEKHTGVGAANKAKISECFGLP
jgi:hypothetical protein